MFVVFSTSQVDTSDVLLLSKVTEFGNFTTFSLFSASPGPLSQSDANELCQMRKLDEEEAKEEAKIMRPLSQSESVLISASSQPPPFVFSKS